MHVITRFAQRVSRCYVGFKTTFFSSVLKQLQQRQDCALCMQKMTLSLADDVEQLGYIHFVCSTVLSFFHVGVYSGSVLCLLASVW